MLLIKSKRVRKMIERHQARVIERISPKYPSRTMHHYVENQINKKMEVSR